MLGNNRKRYYPVILACIVLLLTMVPSANITANDNNDIVKPPTLFVDSREYVDDTEIDFNPDDVPVGLLSSANEPLTDSYSISDIAVINQIIENNGLNLAKLTSGNTPPYEWRTHVLWDNSTPKRISYLVLRWCDLTGTLDISGLKSLKYLDCGGNQLTSLDVSGLKSLESLHCHNNQLTSLVLDNSAPYKAITVYNNFMKDPSVITGRQINWDRWWDTFVFSPQRTSISLNVINGTGGGNYAEGDLITIVADAAPKGQTFEKWISPEGINFTDPHSKNTTFTMPGYAVTVEAVYTVDDDELSKSIILGQDNNSFSHICKNFFGRECTKEEHYDLSNSLFKRLIRNQTEPIKNTVRTAIDREWSGSCFGISSTIALAKVENVNITDYEPDIINYFGLPQPSENPKIRHMIHYYHLSQYLPVIKEAKVNATNPNWFLNQDQEKYKTALQNYKTTLQDIVNKAKKINNGDAPFLVSFGWQKPDGELAGHAVIANSYELVNGEHRIQIYDPNYRQEFLHLTIGADYLSWQLRKADGKQTFYQIDSKNWVCICYLDIDAFNAINIDDHRKVMRAAGLNLPFSNIYIDAASGFTIENNRGDRLVLGEDGLSGDLIPDEIGFIENYTLDGSGSAEMVLSFPEDNAFTIIPANGDVDVSLATSHGFTSVRAERATDITITENSGVKVNGDNCGYTIYVSNDSDNHALIRIDGEKGNEIEVKPVAEGILLKADHLDNVHIQTFGEIEEATLSFSSQDNKVLLKDNLNSTALEVLESANNDEVFGKVIAQTLDYTNWEKIIEQESNGGLMITFNKEVDPASVNTTNIFVATDEAGINKVAGISVIRPADNTKEIKIYPPTKGWQQGSTYYLFIGKNISTTEASANKKLAEPIRACFRIYS